MSCSLWEQLYLSIDVETISLPSALPAKAPVKEGT
nr:MAG TPA: hypothetical protein [Bacteriophage sp.]